MRRATLFVLVFALHAFAQETHRLSGVVTWTEGDVPGCTVILRGATERMAVTDAQGRFVFMNLAPGEYDLEFTLSGFATATRQVGVYRDLELEPQEIRAVFTCGLEACSDEMPASIYDDVHCPDFRTNELLREALERNDPSAVAMLQQRFDNAKTYIERHLIASWLLRKVPDDRRYWDALASPARDAVRFAFTDGEPPQAYRTWCAQRGFDAERHRQLLLHAFERISHDDRARPILLQALETSDVDLLGQAISTFGMRGDDATLPAIRRALARVPHRVGELTWALACFESNAADTIAEEFFDQQTLESYHRSKQDLAEARAELAAGH